MIRRSLCFVLFLLVCVFGIGCNTSRYGVNHDSRLSEYKRIVVLPMGIQMFSLHTGGDLEARPDIASEVRPRLLNEVAAIVEKRGCCPVIAGNEDGDGADAGSVPQGMPLGRLTALPLRIRPDAERAKAPCGPRWSHSDWWGLNRFHFRFLTRIERIR